MMDGHVVRFINILVCLCIHQHCLYKVYVSHSAKAFINIACIRIMSATGVQVYTLILGRYAVHHSVPHGVLVVGLQGQELA